MHPLTGSGLPRRLPPFLRHVYQLQRAVSLRGGTLPWLTPSELGPTLPVEIPAGRRHPRAYLATRSFRPGAIIPRRLPIVAHSGQAPLARFQLCPRPDVLLTTKDRQVESHSQIACARGSSPRGCLALSLSHASSPALQWDRGERSFGIGSDRPAALPSSGAVAF